MKNELKNYIKNIILEGKTDRYFDMFKDILNNEFVHFLNHINVSKENIYENIKEVSLILKKDDRIIWYLLRMKMYYVLTIIDEANYTDEFNNFELKKIISYYSKLKEKLNYKLHNEINEMNIERFVEYLQQLKHYFSLPYQKIQDYTFGNKFQNEIFEDLQKLEREWIDHVSGDLKFSDYQENEYENLIEFPDGKVWVLLNKSYCSKEAKAMGHCGNKTREDSNDRILSLRTKLKKGWKVHLTFILDENGMLGEMKGRGNDKPTSEYYKYIVSLLRDPKIKGIKGGGYKPENNFSLNDLPDDIKNKLIKEKPLLAGINK